MRRTCASEASAEPRAHPPLRSYNHLVNLSAARRKEREIAFWKKFLNGAGGSDAPTIYVEVEEQTYKVYQQLLSDIKTKRELAKSIAALPERMRGVRLLEYYNMLGLSKLEAIVYKINLVPISALPLATQELTKYM